MSKKNGGKGKGADKAVVPEAKKEGRVPRFDGAEIGSTIERPFKDRVIKVQVKADGFHYEGNLYTSLSKIASDITGASTNGPLWFGLRGAIPGARRAEQKLQREAANKLKAEAKAKAAKEKAEAAVEKAKAKAKADTEAAAAALKKATAKQKEAVAA